MSITVERRGSHAGQLRPDDRLSASQRHGPVQLPVPVLHAAGGRGEAAPWGHPLHRGALGDRRRGGSVRGEEDPPHRRGASGAPGPHRAGPPAAGHPRGGGAVPHHQRQPAAKAGKAPAGGGAGPAEHQPGHPAAGPVRRHDPAGDPPGRAGRHPGRGGGGV